jgi:TonB family protein
MGSGSGLGARNYGRAGCAGSFLFFLLLLSALPTWAGKGPAWIELRSPHFIVVTNANEDQARKVAFQFETIRAVFRRSSGRQEASAELPLTILAAKDENTLKALLPEFWAQKGNMHPAGIYLNGTDADYIAIRLDVSLNQEAYEPYEPVYHEYVHYLTRKLIARLPLWMVEGLAEFYGNTRVESKKVYVGAPSTSNVMLLREKTMLPVSTLFSIDASSPYYHEENKTSIFYAESWALTHYLFARDWKENTHRMSDFMGQLAAGVDPSVAAAKTIGDPRSLDEPLQRYVRNLQFTAGVLDPPKIDESGFQVRGMEDAEALAVRGDFMAHDRHYAEAQQMLQDALNADPKLTVAYEGLSFLALQQGKVVEAEKWSAQGIGVSPQSYRASFYYAWSLIRGGHHDEESLAKAEASLRAAVKSNPEFVPAYDALALVLEVEGGTDKLEEAYRMTLEATAREPGNVHYRIRSVEVLERQMRAKDAVTVAALAASMAKTPDERAATATTLANANQFQESMERMKAGGTPASGPGNTQVSVEDQPEGDDGDEQPVRLARQVQASAGIEVISDPQGVDFNPYLSQEVLPKIQRAWYGEAMKIGINAAGKKGRVVVEFAVEKDGSVTGVKLKESSKEDALDEAAGAAITGASPFAPLPAKFRGKSVAMRFLCEYNPGTGTSPAQGQAGKK